MVLPWHFEQAQRSAIWSLSISPTALVDPGRNPAFLVSEAVRGYGAHLRNEEGERFLFHYHEDAELACRDIVARAIATETQNGKTVYLDCRHIVKDFEIHFPTIYKTCLSSGIELKSDLYLLLRLHTICVGELVSIFMEGRPFGIYMHVENVPIRVCMVPTGLPQIHCLRPSSMLMRVTSILKNHWKLLNYEPVWRKVDRQRTVLPVARC